MSKENNESIIKFDKLNKIVDMYHYAPTAIERNRNFSEQIYMILSSSKFKTFGNSKEVIL